MRFKLTAEFEVPDWEVDSIDITCDDIWWHFIEKGVKDYKYFDEGDVEPV